MNTLLNKIVFFDRPTSVLSIIIAAVLIFIISIYLYTNNFRADNTYLKNQILQMHSQSRGIISLRGIVATKEKKVGLSNTSGVVSVLENILTSLNLEASKIKPLDKKKIDEFFEEKAEIELTEADLNSIVNLLYKMDNSPVLIKINSASIKSTFEDPDKFVLNMSLSYVRKG